MMSYAILVDDRYLFERSDDGLLITIPNYIRWAQVVRALIVLPLLVAFIYWAGSALVVINGEFSVSSDTGFHLFWLLGLSVRGLIAIYSIIWQFFGKGIISVNAQRLQFESQLLGWRRSDIYDVDCLHALQFTAVKQYGKTAVNMPLGHLSFNSQDDNGEDVIELKIAITEMEAKQILSLIQTYFPQYDR